MGYRRKREYQKPLFRLYPRQLEKDKYPPLVENNILYTYTTEKSLLRGILLFPINRKRALIHCLQIQ